MTLSRRNLSNVRGRAAVLGGDRCISFVSATLGFAGGTDEGDSPARMDLLGTLNPELGAAATGGKSPSETITRLKQIADEGTSRL